MKWLKYGLGYSDWPGRFFFFIYAYLGIVNLYVAAHESSCWWAYPIAAGCFFVGYKCIRHGEERRAQKDLYRRFQEIIDNYEREK